MKLLRDFKLFKNFNKFKLNSTFSFCFNKKTFCYPSLENYIIHTEKQIDKSKDYEFSRLISLVNKGKMKEAEG